EGLLSVPLARPDRAAYDDPLLVDHHGDGDPADPVLASRRHARIDQRRQPKAVLLHERLDILLAPAVEGDEIHGHVAREARLEIPGALELAGAAGTPRGAEAQDRHSSGEVLRVDLSPVEVRESEAWRFRALGNHEDGRILRGADRDN